MTAPEDRYTPVRLMIEGAETVVQSPEQPPEPPPEDRGRVFGKRGGDGLPDDCPVTPLGIEGEICYYLDASRQLRAVKGEKHSRLNLANLFGACVDDLYKHWPRTNADGDVKGWRPELVAEALMKACARCGVWDVWGRVRGSGAWRGEAGELVMHCGDMLAVGSTLGDPAKPHQPVYHHPGIIGRFVYPAEAARPRPAEHRSGSGGGGPARHILNVFETWNWARGEVDAMLLLGWIAAAMLGGALAWRPLVWITGDRYTGKSTLQDLIKVLLGEAIISVSDATAAGVWQKLGHASLPVALDELESEADNRQARNVIRLARQAASGGVVLRGGADHKSEDFVARSCFLFSSILMPPMMGQDRSRMAILELGRLDKERPPPAIGPDELGQLGRGLRRRLLDNWWRWPETIEAYRQELIVNGHAARGADQFGTLLAAVDLLLYDHPPDGDTLARWGARLKASELGELDDDVADHYRCLERLRTWPVVLQHDNSRQMLGTLIAEACGQVRKGKMHADQDGADEVLGLHGLKVMERDGARWLAVANSHEGLARIFHDTHWGKSSGTLGVWVQALRRIPGVQKDQQRFNGVKCRCTLIPISEVLPDDED